MGQLADQPSLKWRIGVRIPSGAPNIEGDMGCSREVKDAARCLKTKAVPMVERPKVQCDYKAGHDGKHRATVVDKRVEKVVEWSQ